MRAKPKPIMHKEALLEEMYKRASSELNAVRGDRDSLRSQLQEHQQQLANHKAVIESKIKEVGDLKERLLSAELANEFMRGYVARTHESELVAEELITVGDPNGEQQLVPKRKPTRMPLADHFTHPDPRDGYGLSSGYDTSRQRPRSKVWVNY